MAHGDGFRRIGADPFAVPEEAKDPARRLRGRLASPVTVWTAYGPDGSPTGITVSSILVVEGDPPSVVGLIAPLSDFWESATATKRFVVHVLESDQVLAAERFALRYPGDPFDGVSVSVSEYGPVLDDVATRGLATLAAYSEAGYGLIVRASLDAVESPPAGGPPLVHYRGSYFTTGERTGLLPGRQVPGSG